MKIVNPKFFQSSAKTGVCNEFKAGNEGKRQVGVKAKAGSRQVDKRSFHLNPGEEYLDGGEGQGDVRGRESQEMDVVRRGVRFSYSVALCRQSQAKHFLVAQ